MRQPLPQYKVVAGEASPFGSLNFLLFLCIWVWAISLHPVNLCSQLLRVIGVPLDHQLHCLILANLLNLPQK